MPVTRRILKYDRKPPRAGGVTPPDLVHYGDIMIASLTYQIVFIGSVWRTASAHLGPEAKRLDESLHAALNSPDCNQVFADYFPPGTALSATRRASYHVLDMDNILGVGWPRIVYHDDLMKIAQALLDAGELPTSGLDSFALALVLPPGTMLSCDANAASAAAPAVPEGPRNSMEGAAAYHGQLELDQGDGTKVSVYFCVTAWSDGANGAAVPAGKLAGGDVLPAWKPWENACAALYHELAELRLCPNIDKAPPPTPPPIPGLGWLVSYQDNWQEIGDLSVLWAGTYPQKVFCKGTIDGLTVPIQALWSNSRHKPFFPAGFTPQRP